MAWESHITPTGIMRDVDPLSLRSIPSQMRRNQARRTREQSPKTRRWPSRPRFSERLRALIGAHEPQNLQLPKPVSVYAGRFEAAIMWREDIETFGAYLTDTNAAGELEARWFGQTPGQYPTVGSLSEALSAFGVGMDHASQALAASYQNDVWAAVGSSNIVGIRQDDGSHEIAIVTPRGQVQPIAAETERSERSERFGPPSHLGWGENDPRGSLETARVVLDYVDSTGRAPDELFDAAREFSQGAVKSWPNEFAITVSEVHGWSRYRTLVVHQAKSPAIAALRNLAQRPPRRRPDPVARRVPRQAPEHRWPSLGEVGRPASQADRTTTGAHDPTPTTRPQRRRKPVERTLTR